MDDYHNSIVETELKFDGSSISLEEFHTFGVKQNPHLFREIKLTDIYYRQGDNVLRLRYGDTELTLTVKQRLNSKDITSRMECNLRLNQENLDFYDVVKFLELSGWTKELTLERTDWIYDFSKENHEFCLSLYDVVKMEQGKKVGKKIRILELEVNPVKVCEYVLTPQQAGDILKNWLSKLNVAFTYPDKLNLSLYEIFTDKRYKVFDNSKVSGSDGQ